MENEKDMEDIVEEELKKLTQEQANKPHVRYDGADMFFTVINDPVIATSKESVYKSVFCRIVEKEFPNMDIGEVREKMFWAPISMPKEIASIPNDKLVALYDKYRVFIWDYLRKAAQETYGSVMEYLHDLEIMKDVSTETEFVTTLARLAIAHGIITSEVKKKKKSNKFSSDDPFADMQDYNDTGLIQDDIADADDDM